MTRTRPAVFVGSSTEGSAIAEALQVLLDRDCEVELWSQGVFGLSQGTLESLVLALDRFDFAVLVLTPDDMVIRRGEKKAVSRDNVIFELGLFVGGIGRERTFMVYDRVTKPDLPSDLAGITAATFEPHGTGNYLSALGAASTLLKRRVEVLGLRDRERFRQLSDATEGVQGARSQVESLVRLLARSRKVELDVISAQFGSFIDPARLSEIRKDLEDLEQLLQRQER
jgi:hypothetical protein